MGLKTPEEYKKSLRDGRSVYFRGEKVADVTTHPVIGLATEHAALDYRMAEDPRFRDLAVMKADGKEYSRYYHLPRNSADLLKRSELIAAVNPRGRDPGGADQGDRHRRAVRAASARRRTMAAKGKPEYRDRIAKYHAHCRDNDLALAVAQTDVKGDRALGPGAQEHPDYYVRIVEERPDGIVVRGAKVHTSVVTNTNEVIVLPTRAMRPEDRAYAVAFAIPVDTPGAEAYRQPAWQR